MKKVFNTFLCLFLLLGLIGCSDGIKTSELNVPSRPEVKGVEIPLEEVPNATSLTAKRRDKGATEWSNYSIEVSTEDLKKDSKNEDDFGTLVDYFVEPGKEYEYEITFNDTPNTVKTATGIATDGFGEYGLNKETKIIYDDKTGIMTFSPNPRLNEKVLKARPEEVDPTKYYSDRTLSISFSYEGAFSNNIDETEGTINWIKSINNKENYGKPLNFNKVTLKSEICGVTYSNELTLEDLKTATPSIPQTITVPNIIPELKVEATSDGVKINIPNINNKEISKISLDRKHKKSTDTYWIDEYDYAVINNNNKTAITDYFVEPDNSYLYKIKYLNNNDEVIIYTDWSNEVTPTAGVGNNLVIDSAKKALYDDKTGIMTFPDLFGCKNQLDKINAKKIIDLDIEYIGTTYLNAEYNNDTCIINWAAELAKKGAFTEDYTIGKTLTLNGKGIKRIIIDGTNFKVKYNFTEFSSMIPENIIIPDTRPLPRFINNVDGITFLTEYTRNELYNITYTRTKADGTQRTSKSKYSWDINNDEELFSITDYSVNPGEKYIYKVILMMNDSYDTVHFRPIEITAVGVTKN